jgi:hypothetical protein
MRNTGRTPADFPNRLSPRSEVHRDGRRAAGILRNDDGRAIALVLRNVQIPFATLDQVQETCDAP